MCRAAVFLLLLLVLPAQAEVIANMSTHDRQGWVLLHAERAHCGNGLRLLEFRLKNGALRYRGCWQFAPDEEVLMLWDDGDKMTGSLSPFQPGPPVGEI